MEAQNFNSHANPPPTGGQINLPPSQPTGPTRSGFLPLNPQSGFHMSRFRAGEIVPPFRNMDNRINIPRRNDPIELHIPESVYEICPLVQTCLVMLQSETNAHQICGYYCSVLISFFPLLKDAVLSTFAQVGVPVDEVATGIRRTKLAVVMEPGKTVEETMVYFGQATLLLYKNIAAVSYANFMRQMTTALRSHAGVPPSAVHQVPFTIDKAIIIRAVLGSKYGLKKALFEELMCASKIHESFGQVCNYLCDILAWNEMADIVLIYDTLIIPRSPIFKEFDIQGEVRNLYEAFKKINALSTPQYFKILQPPHETKVTERSRFPNIIALAYKLKQVQSSTVAQFVSTVNPESELVARLKAIHDRYIAGRSFTTTRITRVFD